MKTLRAKRKEVAATAAIKAAASKPVLLHVLSDSTGNLVRHRVSSFLTQFQAGAFEVVVKPFVNEPLDLAGLEISPQNFDALQSVDPEAFKAEIPGREELLLKPADDLPREMIYQKGLFVSRL
jgi:hypothetical protein